MSIPVEVQTVGSSLVIRFTRPEIRNPISIEVLTILHSIFDNLDRSIRDKAIFTGSDGVFASGADLREIANVRPEEARDFARRGQSLMEKISKCRVMTISAVNGLCFGGALDLSLACSRRIAGAQALFSHPGANLGIITGWGGTQRLPRLIGRGRALEMLFTARRVGAEEALSIGLVDEIADDTLEAALRAA